MAAIAPPPLITAPSVQARRFGLLSVASMPATLPRWEDGYEWEPLTTDGLGIATVACDTDDTAGWPLTMRTGEHLTGVRPFVVYGSYACKSASRPIEQAEERARAHLAAWEETAIEYAVATGAYGNYPSFAVADDVTPTAGTAVSITDGIGILESALALSTPNVGTIHTPRVLVPALDSAHLVTREGQRLETALGTFVAAGSGYDLANVGPDGEAPDAGEAWLYATGRPILHRSEVFVLPDSEFFLNKLSNDVEIVAARTYALGWEHVTAAVLVDAPAIPAPSSAPFGQPDTPEVV